MDSNFTQNNLIRYVYNEMSLNEQKEFKLRLMSDTDLKHQYLELLQLKSKIDEVSIEPNQTSVDLILEHSKAYSYTQQAAFQY